MAYDRQKLYEEALLNISADPNIVFIYEVYDSLGINHQTFYNHFTDDNNNDLEELEAIKRALVTNKARIKKDLRKEFTVGSSAEKIALYKLLGNEQELQSLNGQYIDHTTKGKEITENRNTDEILKDVKRLATIIEATKGTSE